MKKMSRHPSKVCAVVSGFEAVAAEVSFHILGVAIVFVEDL